MSFLLRKLRGIVGMGLTCGAIVASLGAVLGILAGILRPEDIGPGVSPARMAWIVDRHGCSTIGAQRDRIADDVSASGVRAR